MVVEASHAKGIRQGLSTVRRGRGSTPHTSCNGGWTRRHHIPGTLIANSEFLIAICGPGRCLIKQTTRLAGQTRPVPSGRHRTRSGWYSRSQPRARRSHPACRTVTPITDTSRKRSTIGLRSRLYRGRAASTWNHRLGLQTGILLPYQPRMLAPAGAWLGSETNVDTSRCRTPPSIHGSVFCAVPPQRSLNMASVASRPPGSRALALFALCCSSVHRFAGFIRHTGDSTCAVDRPWGYRRPRRQTAGGRWCRILLQQIRTTSIARFVHFSRAER